MDLLLFSPLPIVPRPALFNGSVNAFAERHASPRAQTFTMAELNPADALGMYTIHGKPNHPSIPSAHSIYPPATAQSTADHTPS